MGSPPFTTLDMSSPCLLAPMFSDEKRTFNLIEYAWYVMSHFSLVAFRILSLTFASLIMMYFSMDLYKFIPLGSLLIFLDV